MNYTERSLLADANSPGKMVLECRARAVSACIRQADCTFGDSDGSLARELAKCDKVANASVFEPCCFAGTLAVLVVIAFMLCSAFRLASERQVRSFGLGVGRR